VISFRYHLVSIIAVFLALAVGIVVGTTALNGPVTTDLRHQVNSLKNDRTHLNDQVKTLQAQVDSAGQFASTFGSQLVAGTLKGKSVLVIGLPGVASGMEDGIASQLTAAGAQLTGRLNLAHDYIDQSEAAKIDTLVTTNHPMGLTLPQGTSDARVLGAAALAYVLLGQGEQTDLKTVLSGFASLHMLASDASDIDPATSIVVIGSGTMPKNSYGGQAEVDLISALQVAKGNVVVAGDAGSATGGGVVALVRTGSEKSSVSTVDNADTAFGQVSTVLALAQAENSQVGHYGMARGADALFPTPGG
jgi:hypothetical protein